jgi:hypothetical protein
MSTKLENQAARDLELLTKIASTAKNTMAKEVLKSMVGPLLGTLAVVGTSGLASYFFAKRDKEQHAQDLKDSMGVLFTRVPAFSKKPTEFVERFGELTVISPTIAKNPSLAAKVLEKKLDSGFSIDDVHKLTSIEHNTMTGRPHFAEPGPAGRAAAASTLGTLVTTFGPGIIQNQKGAVHKVQVRAMSAKDSADSLQKRIDALEARRAKSSIKKEGSMQRVSDECLGAMLAERYVLFKTAGLGDLLMAGAKNVGKGIAVMAPAIALAGGVELVRRTLESHRTAELEQQADFHFKDIIKNNPKISTKEEKDLAHEAFNTLKAVAPSLAARPLVARTFINDTVGQGILNVDRITQIAEAENKIRGLGSKSTFFQDLQGRVTDLGSLGTTKKVLEEDRAATRGLGGGGGGRGRRRWSPT